MLLRPFALSDVDDVHQNAADPEYGSYLLDTPRHFSRGDAERLIARAVLASWDTEPIFAIVVGGKVIGETYLNIEPKKERAELGYALAARCRGKGMATEAARAIITWGFQTRGLQRIFAMTSPENERSWRLMERLGMAREGLLRSHEEWRGERRDSLVYGILRHEWAGEVTK